MPLSKILNIAFLALILTLILQMMMPKPQNAITSEGVYMSAQSSEITVPNIPKISLHNTSSWSVTINPCTDVTISVNSQPFQNIATAYPEFCTPLTVASGQVGLLNLNPLYKQFASHPGNYIITTKTPFGDRNIAIKLDTPGVIRSFASAVIFEPIYNLFVGILQFLPGHELGWAIIIITIIIRLILLVPQNKMLESNKKMSVIAPKIKALQKEYEHDKATLWVKMMELYKKEWVNPAGSCLPLLIQIPIMIGLYWVISGISDPSNFYHLYSFFKDFNPASIQTNFYGLNLLQIGGVAGGVMAILLAATQWYQSYMMFKNQPKSVQKEVLKKENDITEAPALDPVMLQKMSLYLFPILIGISGFMFPLGLGLYWWIGLLFMIAQQYYVNMKHEKSTSKGEIVTRK